MGWGLVTNLLLLCGCDVSIVDGYGVLDKRRPIDMADKIMERRAYFAGRWPLVVLGHCPGL
jgi:hypothetical protein